LRGAGKPLNLEEDAMVPEDLRMAFRLLRSNGLAPLWVQLNREIRDDIERLHRFQAFVASHWRESNPIQQEHHRREFAARVRDINDRILHYNISAPSLLVHLPMLIVDDELAKFDRATGGA
jgi:DnaJ homolog subfamily C member 28